MSSSTMRCMIWIEGLGACDVSNLLNEESLCQFLQDLRLGRNSAGCGVGRRRRPFPSSSSGAALLYPNLQDPCNKRMIQDIELSEWKSVPLVKLPPPPPDPPSPRPSGLLLAGGEDGEDKLDDFYEQQRRDMERFQEQHYREEEEALLRAANNFASAHRLTRAQTAPLHRTSSDGSSSEPLPAPRLSLSAQTSTGAATTGRLGWPNISSSSSHSTTPTTRQSLPTPRAAMAAARRQNISSSNIGRHSTSAFPGDIESSSSGLRPKVNYKALYNRGQNLSGSNHGGGGSSSGSGDASTAATSMTSLRRRTTSGGTLLDDDTSASSPQQDRAHHHLSLMHERPRYDMAEESPEDDYPEDYTYEDEEEFDHPGLPETPQEMEIAPSVKVEVRAKQETYRAVQAGDYTVATCFACTTTIVCVDDAAYVLCPECQVVSPLGITAGAHEDSANVSPKKDEPYGIGIGFKREWVSQWVRQY